MKGALIAAFEKYIKPLHSNFYFQNPAGEAMETKQYAKLNLNFNPLSSKTTCQMLRDIIERTEPDFDVPKVASCDGLLCLYKAYVDHDIIIPTDS